MWINTSFDFRADARGRDPDKYSNTLREYHQVVWSKPLPNGRTLHLVSTTPGVYLHHRSELGEFSLSSDSIIQSFTAWKTLKHITDRFSQEQNDAFRASSYTMGGMIIFPANKVGGKMTINGARGCNRKIADRFDLTLECIRRNYLGQISPLSDTLSRYSEFFDLFDNFTGYVEFFLLQDLVNLDSSSVKFFLPFDDFNNSSVPEDVDAYIEYRQYSIEFVEARNCRIAAGTNPHSTA